MLCGWRVLRVQCLVSTHQLQERENIKFVCAQWPVTRCAKLRLITINNNQLNVTISITVIINSWWDCFWLGKQVILSLAVPRVSSKLVITRLPLLVLVSLRNIHYYSRRTLMKYDMLCYVNASMLQHAALLKFSWRQSPLHTIRPNRYKWMVIFTSIGSTGAALRKW